MSETIRTAYNEYVEASPTMFVDALDLQIGDIILPVDNGNGTIRYSGFYLPNGDMAVFDDDFEGCMTVNGFKVDDNDDVTIWAELVWYGEPTEDNSGSFVYRRQCDAFPAHYLPYEIMRR
jgi:hypothetical protein